MFVRRRPLAPPVMLGGLCYQVSAPDSQPRHILEEIVWHKETEVSQLRAQTPLDQIKLDLAPPVRDFRAALLQRAGYLGVIAEVKKASPSKGLLRADFDPVAIAQAYERGGAACLSVLTDQKFFQGSFANLAAVRGAVNLPLLCKEFIIYPYQIYLARQHGADAVLLIAALLPDQDLKSFLKITHGLGMQALVEVHTLAELDRVLGLGEVDLVGINNRNLENFTVSLETTRSLLQARGAVMVSRGVPVVSESGLASPADLELVRQAGATAVLIGESLVTKSDPGLALGKLLQP